jgi:small subunit ribosomal protein S9
VSEEDIVSAPETEVAEPQDQVEAPESQDQAAADADVVDVAEAADATDVVDVEGEVVVEGEGDETAAPAPVIRLTGEVAQTVGRRKEAVVRVRLTPGSGQFRLNGKTLEEYFPNKVHQQLIREPLVTVEKPEIFDVRANLKGGGTTGQAGALRLAIARALIEIDPDDRPALKKAGFLTRDPRVKERKKYGLKKARKAPQYSKR